MPVVSNRPCIEREGWHSLKKTPILSFARCDDAVEHCSPSEEDDLRKVLCEGVARSKGPILREGIQDEEGVCWEAVLVDSARSLLGEQRKKEVL